jgi:hypothetical protein
MNLAVRIAAAATLVLAPNPAAANGPEVGFDGGGIVPLASHDIQLVRENVELFVTLSDEYAPGRAECHYVLANPTSKSRTISMSFVGGYASGSVDFGPPPAPTEFRVQVGFVPVPVRTKKVDRNRWARFGVAIPDSLPVWDVTIPARDSAIVDIEYPIHWSGGSDGSTDSRDLHYFAHPAALWAGTIREATFRLHLGRVTTALLRNLPFNRDEGPVRLSVHPGDATWTPDGIAWRRTNWEPNHDFRFGIDWDVDDYDDD